MFIFAILLFYIIPSNTRCMALYLRVIYDIYLSLSVLIFRHDINWKKNKKNGADEREESRWSRLNVSRTLQFVVVVSPSNFTTTAEPTTTGQYRYVMKSAKIK